MTAGPVMKRTAMAKVAMEFPHAIIFGCNAMNKPATPSKIIQLETNPALKNTTFSHQIILLIPRLNMAIPRPALDRMAIEPAMIAGIVIFHL